MIILAHFVVFLLVLFWIYGTFIKPMVGFWILNLSFILLGVGYLIMASIMKVVEYWTN